MTKVSFKRKEFFIQLRREPSESYDTLLGFNMASHKRAKILWQSCVEHHSFFRLQKPHRPNRFALLGSKFRYSGRTELQAVQDSKTRVKMSKTFVRSPSRRTIGSPIITDSNGTSNGKISFTKSRAHDNKITVTDSKSPRKAWEHAAADDSENGEIRAHFDSSVPPIFDSPPAYETNEITEKFLEEEGLVSVRLYADEQGRYGFNVKGGKDLDMPIFVSRVAHNTPAYNSKICENDQVMMINGRNVSSLTHDQVVSLIRNSRETNDGQLNLIIKPNNALEDGYSVEEPLYQYVPEDQSQFRNSQHSFMTGSSEANLFQQSLLLLSDGIASGALFQQYEQLYRKNNDLAITEARKVENASKNRYRDISPCE